MRPVSDMPLEHGDAVEMVAQPKTSGHDAEIPEAKSTMSNVDAVNDEDLEDHNARLDTTKSTRADAENMRRMGKDQQLIRRFRLMSVASFIALTTVSWEYAVFTLGPGLVNGGRAGLVYSTFWSFIGFGPVYFSMAEMASMAPIAGAQYHWVSEFAPESCQKILSYLIGWASTIAWQAGNASGMFLLGSTIQTMIVISNENYEAKAWQSTLLAFAAIIIAYVGNVYGSRLLPYWQNALFAIHVMAFFAYIVPIWVSAPTATHEQVWGEFEASGGWNGMGLTIMVGQLTGIANQLGVDAAAHMAEEVKDAGISVPKSMISIYLVNFLLLWPTVLTVVYHIPSMDDALADTTGYPALYVLRQSMSPTWVNVLLAIITFIFIAANITYLAAVTRDLFAFARDEGLPFSAWISKVDSNRHLPVNAAILTSGVAVLMALIYLGSTVAFYAIISLFTAAILSCYCFSIGCVLWRRIFLPETLPPARFSLGKMGIPLNAFAVLFSAYCLFWSFWPQEYPVTTGNFNWASVIFGGTMIIALIYFVFKARHVYVGPVATVDGRKIRVE